MKEIHIESLWKDEARYKSYLVREIGDDIVGSYV
jgi:hypothetical protein